jgi:hypothetical protein
MKVEDNDLKTLHKRLLITVVIFLMILTYQFMYKRDLNIQDLFTTTVQESLVDSLYVRSKDANMSQVIIKYNIVISPNQMDELHRYAFNNHTEEYKRNLISLNVKDGIKTEIGKNISFNDPTSLIKFRTICAQVISSKTMFAKETGVKLESFELDIRHDAKIVEKFNYAF